MIKNRKETLEARIAKLERTLRPKNEESWAYKQKLSSQILDLVRQLNGFERIDKEMREFADSYAQALAEDKWYDDDDYEMLAEARDFGEDIKDLLIKSINTIDYSSLAETIINGYVYK